jgi:prolipoprotein diacylglyceryltransferase
MRAEPIDRFLSWPICRAADPAGPGRRRLGNFINHEPWGRVTDVPWGMVFPNADRCRVTLHNYGYTERWCCFWFSGFMRASRDRS